ncbi:MAG TPA: alkaline phosphatase family protein [Acidobacteriota bacterium]
MRNLLSSLAIACLALTVLISQPSQNKESAGVRRPRVELPGQRADGSVLLPNQWSLRPAGRQVLLGDFPVNIAVHPSSRFAAVLHCGYSVHEIIIVEIPQDASPAEIRRAGSQSSTPAIDIPPPQLVSHVALPEAFYGIEFSHDGKMLFCSGAGSETIHVFDFKDGYLFNARQIALHDRKDRGIPAGIAVDRDARRLYAANVLGHSISEVDLTTGRKVSDIALTETAAVDSDSLSGNQKSENPQSAIRNPQSIDPDIAAVTKRGEALLVDTRPNDPYPYACRLDEQRQKLYVSLWAQSSVAVLDLKSRRITARWPTEEHPNEMLLNNSGRILYVANANRNTVTVIDAQKGQPLETIYASLYPDPLPGACPNSLALSQDEKILFVANANNNNVAVFDVGVPGKSRSMGFIPVGWYPTSVRVTPDGHHLLVANGKGLISRANWNGPQPGKDPPASVREYIGSLFRGTLTVIDLPQRSKFEQQLASYTAQAYSCTPKPAGAQARASASDGALANSAPSAGRNPIPEKPGDSSPIKYCIYIIKENRTYDQVLGDMPEGNGEPSLCLFPERITPNHHRLAREFVLLDNFYVEAEVSADGHEWSMGAYATDFVEKFWPLSYGHNKSQKYFYPAEGRFRIAEPSEGYIWDRARQAGVSYRSYGEFIDTPKNLDEPAKTRVASLQGHFDPWYRPWDLEYPDIKRARRFISELKRFENEGEMPRLQIVRLGNDHTYGTAPDKLSPTALVGDNDAALGMLVDAVSHSKFWPQTAIFVLEDDAQNGPDHIDAHRSPGFVISPYVRRGSVDSTMYSTSSMLHTIELILGLKPMSQYDAAAMPMFNAFQPGADARPYQALPANVDLNERNKKSAFGSRLSSRMDFSKEDAADDLLLNEVIWKSIRGAHSPMPRPTRAGFVFTRPVRDADDR